MYQNLMIVKWVNIICIKLWSIKETKVEWKVEGEVESKNVD